MLAKREKFGVLIAEAQSPPSIVMHVKTGLRTQTRRGHLARRRQKMRVIIALIAAGAWCMNRGIDGRVIAIR